MHIFKYEYDWSIQYNLLLKYDYDSSIQYWMNLCVVEIQ